MNLLAIRRTVKKINRIRQYRLDCHDLDDIVQNAAMAILRDPKGRRYIHCKYALLRFVQRGQGKANDNRKPSIDGRSNASDYSKGIRRYHFSFAVNDILLSLPEDLRPIAELLAAGTRAKEVASLLGMSEPTVCRRIAKIRSILEANPASK